MISFVGTLAAGLLTHSLLVSLSKFFVLEREHALVRVVP